jgi:hypothetical protein
MRLLRWILLIPGAVLFGIVGSLAGGLAASPFGQAAADTASAFAGPFGFVFGACLISPSRRQTVGLLGVTLVGILALGTFVLSTFTAIEEFARLPLRERIASPVAQFLGGLYALFIALPILAGATLEALWRELVSLGTLVVMLGVTLMVAGAGVGLLGRGWLGFAVGLAVFVIGAITWLWPFVQVTIRTNRVQVAMQEQLRESIDREDT